MRILHVIGSADPALGGPIEGILRQHSITKGSVSREIVCCDGPEDPWIETLPIRIHAVGRPRVKTSEPLRRFQEHYRYTPHLLPWLRSNIHKYSAVIVNGMWNYSTLAASRTLPNSAIPYLVFTHGQLDPWYREAYAVKDVAKQLFWWFSEGKLVSGAYAVCFTCEQERRLVRGRYLGHQNYREVVVGYGTTEPPPATMADLPAFRDRVPQLLPERRFLLFLSRIHLKKGCDLLIEAFGRLAARFPTVDLVMAGPDQDGWAQTLGRRSTELGVASRVHWTGMLAGGAKWGAIRAAEALVLPSHAENFGIVVAEAMACETPVLISDKVNIWREVDQCGGGLVGQDTVEGTTTLIEKWLSMAEDSRQQMRRAARLGFEQHFRMEVATERLLDLVRKSTKEREETHTSSSAVATFRRQ